MDGAEGDEKILADRAEEAEVEQRLESFAGRGPHGLEHADRLGADEEAREGVAGGVAERGSEDGDEGDAFGGRTLSLARAALDLVDVDLVVGGGERGELGGVRQENGGEVLVADAGPVEGTGKRVAVRNLLEGDVLVLAVLHGVDLRAGVGLHGFRVAEAGGPGEERADGGAVAEDDGVGVDGVGVGVEREGFVNDDVSGGRS